MQIDIKKRGRAALFLILGILFFGCDSSSTKGDTTGNGIITKPDVTAYPEANLTEEMKYTLAYMWNEEKLAKDIYLAFYTRNEAVEFYTIATKGETTHQGLVHDLVEKYDLNITNLVDYEVRYTEAELDALGQGVFALPELQTLYDTYYAQGAVSLQDAYKTGCQIEVKNINDLEEKITLSGTAQDMADVFTYLKQGSYKHYWTFSDALAAQGVSDGCCSLGIMDGIDYCHPEYPK